MRYPIKKYQQELKNKGFYTDLVDKEYGPNTKRAVMEFQKSWGIEVDGIVGPETWEALFPATVSNVVGNEPPWITELLDIDGWHEVRNRKALIAWLKSDGSTVGDPSKIPWCGDAVETAIKLTLSNEVWDERLKKNPYWAQNWQYFGKSLDKARYGATLVFKRNGGGHVGFYVGETKTHYLVLGGNQSNKVTVSKIAKNRCIAIRWPNSAKEAYINTKEVDPKSIKISTNEK